MPALISEQLRSVASERHARCANSVVFGLEGQRRWSIDQSCLT